MWVYLGPKQFEAVHTPLYMYLRMYTLKKLSINLDKGVYMLYSVREKIRV